MDTFLVWICILKPFQEYFTYIKLIIKQKWVKTGVPEGKPDLQAVVVVFLFYVHSKHLWSCRDDQLT